MKNRGFNLTAARQIVQPQLVAVLEGDPPVRARIRPGVRPMSAICLASKAIPRYGEVGSDPPPRAGGALPTRPLSAARPLAFLPQAPTPDRAHTPAEEAGSP